MSITNAQDVGDHLSDLTIENRWHEEMKSWSGSHGCFQK